MKTTQRAAGAASLRGRHRRRSVAVPLLSLVLAIAGLDAHAASLHEATRSAWIEFFARCGPSALDRARLRCPATGDRHTLCGERLYRMRPLVEQCGFRRAVELALEDTHRGRFPADSAKVLWFEPGGDYLIDEPVVVGAPGVVFRGDGAPVTEPAAARDWRRLGTAFRCAVGAGRTCLTFERPYGAEGPAGVRFEGITLLWEGDSAAPSEVVGLRLVNLGGAAVRSCQWLDFPGRALVASGVHYSRFEDLRFVSSTGASSVAVYAEVGPEPGAGRAAAGPNGNVLEGLAVQGYDYGVWYVGGNSVSIENSSFTDSRMNALRLDGNESLVVRRVRFQDAQQAASGDVAYIRIERQDGWWIPDVTLSELYFNCDCREGRYPVTAEAVTTSAGPFARVRIIGSTFRNCAPGVLLRGDPRTVWQCSQDRVVQRVATAPSRYVSYTLDACDDPTTMPVHPVECE